MRRLRLLGRPRNPDGGRKALVHQKPLDDGWPGRLRSPTRVGELRYKRRPTYFRVETILYPTGRFDLETDDVSYSVQFKDKQFSITVEDLPRALAHYEEKFTELTTLLRRTDPMTSEKV